MTRRKTLLYIIYVSILIIITILPIFLPLSIEDDSYQAWNGQDLAKNVIGDSTYYNNTYFNFTQPNNLSAFDVRGESYESQLLLTTLQGLVNRKNVSLYLIYRDSDEFWLQQLNQTSGINFTMLNYPSYWNVVEKFNDSINGLIIYDPELLASVNVATFLAGVYNCVVIQEDLLSNFSAIGINNVVFDFRNKFSSRVELYSWAWNIYGQNATKKMVSSLDPKQTYFRDYIVAAKVFTFFLSSGPFGPSAEINLMKQILSNYPQNTPVFGWFTDPGGALGEYESVKILSRIGLYSLCAAIPDLTVFSSVSTTPIQQKKVTFNASTYPIENKVYVTVVVSDGDNVNYCADRLQQYWQDPNRGSIPIGITLEPAMFKIFPTNLKFYYQSATSNEYFLAGPSGAGYCYVDMNPAFSSYLNQSKYALDQANMQQVWLLNGYEGYQLQYSKEILNAYTSPNCNLSGIYLNYNDFPAELNYIINDVPVFQSIFVERENELVGKLQALRLANPFCPIFAFIGFWAWDFSFSKLKSTADQLGIDFVFLRPDHFTQLYVKSQGSSEIRASNEFLMFVLAGIIPLLISMIALVFIWIYYKKKSKVQFESEAEGFKTFSSKAIFLIVDLSFLLIMRMCFYSTILNLIYFLFLILSIAGGIFLKKYIDELIGIKKNLINSLFFLILGSVLFFLYPEFIILVGFSVGMLLCHQIMSSSTLFSIKNPSKRDFVYLIIIASAIILLFPQEYYNYLLFITIIISIPLIVISSFFLLKEANKVNEIHQLDEIKSWYPKGIFIGLLMTFLLSPTFSPERLFFHLYWGSDFFPTRLTLSFNVASIYLIAILILEIIRLNKFEISKRMTIILSLLGIFFYTGIPLLLSGVIFFMLSMFVFIFGMLNCIIFVFENFSNKIVDTSSESFNYYKKSVNGFANQSVFWLMLGSFLVFVPSSIIIVDAQEIFVQIGMVGISQINWPSFVWCLIYIPPIQVFLMVPITIGVLLYGLASIFFS
ncbi:MAG: GxGYxYP domain-containing protein [Candidatus Helarchaeota archaeon]